MRKYLITALVSLIFPGYIFSQDSLAAKQQPPFSINNIDTPLLIIKGDEFKRFPSTDFLEAVNGLFPWVFSQVPDANNFLFVVDGYVLPDVNGISLYDIDEVIFTRNKLVGSFYPFSRAGIFYIITKRTDSRKPVINFNSQYNTSWNKEAMVFIPSSSVTTDPSYVTHSMNKGGHFSSQQVSLGLGSKKFHLYVSGQFDETKTPHLFQQFSFNFPGNATTFDGNSFTRQYNLKTFLNLEYHFSPKLSAGITGNYFHGNTKQDTLESSATMLSSTSLSGSGTINSHTPITYYHLGSFINWAPFQNFRNRVSFEYMDEHFDYENILDSKSYLADTLVYSDQVVKRTNPSEKKYVLRDQAEFEFISKGKFRLSTELVFSYLYNKLSFNSSYFSTNGSAGTSFFYGKQKSTSLNPAFRFSYSNIISGYAGNAFILNKGISRFTNHPNSNPYAGLALDIKNLLKIHEPASRLDISFNYADMTQNNSDNNWLAGMRYPGQYYINSQLYSSNVAYYPTIEPVIFKNKLTSVQLNSGFMHNRIIVGAEWSVLQLQRLYLVPIPLFPNGIGYYWALGKETQTGTSCYIAGKLIDRPRRQWDMRINVLFPHIKYALSSNGSEPPLDMPVNYTAQAGWQNKFRLGEFYLQANALFGLNRESSAYPGSFSQEKKKFNEIVLNYLLVGYDLAGTKNSALKNLSVFVQAKNLLSSKEAKAYYQYDSYAGIGINVKIN